MTAVFKREFKGYFSSPLGYIFLAVMFFFSGQFFSTLLALSYAQIELVFSSMFTVVTMLIPILTMRLMSEDKKLRIDQLYLTAPVSIGGVVLGKYLAACAVYLIGIAPTILYTIILATFTTPDWNVFLGNFFALALLGAAMLAIGIFVSSTTESQMVAAILSYAILMFIMLFDTIVTALPSGLSFLEPVLRALSFLSRYNDFMSGILNVSHIILFVSFVVVFNFLTIRVLEKKRWG